MRCWKVVLLGVLFGLLSGFLLLVLLVAGVVYLERILDGVESELLLLQFFGLEAALDGLNIGEIAFELFLRVEGYDVRFPLFGLHLGCFRFDLFGLLRLGRRLLLLL